jgi:hypothetical protein
MVDFLKRRSEDLYSKLKSERNKLVDLYERNMHEVNGVIRYDVACGVINSSMISNVKVYTENQDSAVSTERECLNFDKIGYYNAYGNVDGYGTDASQGSRRVSMYDALKKNAKGKIVQLYSNDLCLKFGMVVLGEVPCLLRIMNDINKVHSTPQFIKDDDTTLGLAHSLEQTASEENREQVETENVFCRGLFKPNNYRGDAELLKNPISIWSLTDKSRNSIALFGFNSLIRMWGKNQIIDLAGNTLDINEETTLFAGFACIIDLADAEFAALATTGAQNAFIYSSKGIGRLGRCNHHAIRGSYCSNILVENIRSGNILYKNKNSYFGTAIFNNSSNIVFKNVHQEQLNKHVPRSSLGLNWYADLTMWELLSAKLETPKTFNPEFYQWLKWERIAEGEQDNYNNGMKTLYPVIKTYQELMSINTNLTADIAQKIHHFLQSAQEAYRASSINADDVHIQINPVHGHNFKPLVNGKITDGNQMARTTNLVCANALNRDKMNMYPDSIVYGFRAGSTIDGTGNLATQRDGSSNNIYLIDCSFDGSDASMMEAVSIATDDIGLFKTFNGQALRPFGYSNNRNLVAGVAAGSMLVSHEEIAEVFGVISPTSLGPLSLPYTHDNLDMAKIAFNNAKTANGDTLWNSAKQIGGLYKGNDVLESSLATLTAVCILSKYFTSPVLSGIEKNSNMDIGILAWRYSMMKNLNAFTANHIGLKSGYNGDLTDRVNNTDPNTRFNGELYGWFVGKDVSGDIRMDGTCKPTDIRNKDNDYIAAKEIPGNTNCYRNLLQSGDHYKVPLPEPSDDLFKFKLGFVDPLDKSSGITLTLCKSTDNSPVTYADCAILLGFDRVGLNTIKSESPVVYKLVQNLDGQNHVHKGLTSIRLDQIVDSAVIRCKARDMENVGFLPEPNLIGNKEFVEELGVADALRPGSKVNDCTGISLNGVTNCYVDDFEYREVEALGDICAIQVSGESTCVEINNVYCDELTAGSIYNGADHFNLSNKLFYYPTTMPPKCTGVYIAQKTDNCKLSNINAINLESPAIDQIKIVSINAPSISSKKCYNP